MKIQLFPLAIAILNENCSSRSTLENPSKKVTKSDFLLKKKKKKN